jgi:hypothetical protein
MQRWLAMRIASRKGERGVLRIIGVSADEIRDGFAGKAA